jgi:hypothetical protein
MGLYYGWGYVSVLDKRSSTRLNKHILYHEAAMYIKIAAIFTAKSARQP